MELWCVLSASGTQTICEVPAFYARCLLSGKPIAKKFPTPDGEENQDADRRNYSILLEVRLGADCLRSRPGRTPHEENNSTKWQSSGQSAADPGTSLNKTGNSEHPVFLEGRNLQTAPIIFLEVFCKDMP